MWLGRRYSVTMVMKHEIFYVIARAHHRTASGRAWASTHTLAVAGRAPPSSVAAAAPVHVHNVQVGDYGLSHNGVLIWRRQAAAMEMQMDSAYDRPYRKGRTRGRRR